MWLTIFPPHASKRFARSEKPFSLISAVKKAFSSEASGSVSPKMISMAAASAPSLRGSEISIHGSWGSERKRGRSSPR